MSAFEYQRRLESEQPYETIGDPAVLLLEAARILVDLALALNTVAKVLHERAEKAQT